MRRSAARLETNLFQVVPPAVVIPRGDIAIVHEVTPELDKLGFSKPSERLVMGHVRVLAQVERLETVTIGLAGGHILKMSPVHQQAKTTRVHDTAELVQIRTSPPGQRASQAITGRLPIQPPRASPPDGLQRSITYNRVLFLSKRKALG